MSGKESLSLDEFATAPRRQRPAATNSSRGETDRPGETGASLETAAGEERGRDVSSNEASKALRQMKRARMKGTNHFVNVSLDRDTKRRLKLASFNMETSMQALMEKAIRQYLDAKGF